MNDSELHDVLHRATEHVESPDLAREALVEARRRHFRRRAGLASAAAAVVVGAVVVGSLVSGADHDATPAPAPTLPTNVPSEVEAVTPPLWDPFTIPALPVRASVLPQHLTPPDGPPSVLDQPMSAAVLALPEEGRLLRLLGTDGEWRSVPGTSNAIADSLRPVVDPAISHDGRQVAMSVDSGILVVDVTAGESRIIPWPEEIAGPWDSPPSLLWRPADDGFVVLHWRETWFVGLDGAGRKAPYGGRYVSLAVDPAGQTYQHDYDWRRLLTWQGDVRVDDSPFPQCERLVAAQGMVACTTGSIEPFRSGPVVVDAASGEVLGYAPIKDKSAVYSDNGHLTAMGFLDADTVLLLVAPMDSRTMEIGEGQTHLVAWRFRTGEFERISSGRQGLRTIEVAPALVE